MKNNEKKLGKNANAELNDDIVSEVSGGSTKVAGLTGIDMSPNVDANFDTKFNTKFSAAFKGDLFSMKNKNAKVNIKTSGRDNQVMNDSNISIS